MHNVDNMSPLPPVHPLGADETTIQEQVHITDRVSCDICGYSQTSFPKLLSALARRHIELHYRILENQRQTSDHNGIDTHAL